MSKDAAKVARAERRVINAALRLLAAGHGWIFSDTGKVSDQRLARKLEDACWALKEMRK